MTEAPDQLSRDARREIYATGTPAAKSLLATWAALDFAARRARQERVEFGADDARMRVYLDHVATCLAAYQNAWTDYQTDLGQAGQGEEGRTVS